MIVQENREFFRIGTVAAAIYNVNRDPKRHPQALDAFDIFPISRPPAPKLTPDELLQNADRVFAEHNKKVVRMNGRQFRKPA